MVPRIELDPGKRHEIKISVRCSALAPIRSVVSTASTNEILGCLCTAPPQPAQIRAALHRLRDK